VIDPNEASIDDLQAKMTTLIINSVKKREREEMK
jgi:hypothetical protein